MMEQWKVARVHTCDIWLYWFRMHGRICQCSMCMWNLCHTFLWRTILYQEGCCWPISTMGAEADLLSKFVPGDKSLVVAC